MSALPIYTDLLTQASYLHAPIAMPNAINFFKSVNFTPVPATTGTIVYPNLTEQRRNDVATSKFGEPMRAKITDNQSTSYSVKSVYDAQEISGVDLINASYYGGVSAASEMTALAELTAENALVALMKQWADEFMAEGNYAIGSKTDPTNWTVSTTDLVQQIRLKITSTQLASGVRPDTIVTTPDVHDVIRMNVQVLDALAGFGGATAQGSELQGGADEQALARIFGVRKYFVLDASYNGAGLRSTASNNWITSNRLLLANFGSSVPTAGGIKMFGGSGVGVYMDFSPRLAGQADIISNGLGSFPFPIITQNTYDAQYTGGGKHFIQSEINADFQLIEPVYNHLFYGVIS